MIINLICDTKNIHQCGTFSLVLEHRVAIIMVIIDDQCLSSDFWSPPRNGADEGMSGGIPERLRAKTDRRTLSIILNQG